MPNTMFLGIALVVMGIGQFLVRDKWAASMIDVIEAFKVKRLRGLTEKVILRIGISLMGLFVTLGAVLIIISVRS